MKKIIEGIIRYVEDYPYSDNYTLVKKSRVVSNTVFLLLDITYKGGRQHSVQLEIEDSELVWSLMPYKDAYFRTCAKHEAAFDFVLLAIAEHHDIHGYV